MKAAIAAFIKQRLTVYASCTFFGKINSLFFIFNLPVLSFSIPH